MPTTRRNRRQIIWFTAQRHTPILGCRRTRQLFMVVRVSSVGRAVDSKSVGKSPVHVRIRPAAGINRGSSGGVPSDDYRSVEFGPDTMSQIHTQSASEGTLRGAPCQGRAIPLVLPMSQWPEVGACPLCRDIGPVSTIDGQLARGTCNNITWPRGWPSNP